MNQSEFLEITFNSLKGREKSRVQGAMCFASHWLKNCARFLSYLRESFENCWLFLLPVIQEFEKCLLSKAPRSAKMGGKLDWELRADYRNCNRASLILCAWIPLQNGDAFSACVILQTSAPSRVFPIEISRIQNYIYHWFPFLLQFVFNAQNDWPRPNNSEIAKCTYPLHLIKSFYN